MTHGKPLIGLSLFLVVSTVATWLVFTTLRREVQGTTSGYSAMFTDVSGLKVGDDVKIAGVRVGRVDSIDLDGVTARVGFRLAKDQQLFTDTIASVTYQNIIGQRYLALAPGSDPRHTLMAENGLIPVERTRASFDISSLLNGFEPLFALINPEQVDNFTTAIVDAFKGDSGSVLALITQTSALAQTLAGPDAVLGDLIVNLNEVTAALAKQDANLQELISQSSGVMTTLSDRREELVSSVSSIGRSVDRLAQIMATIYPDLTALIAREPGFLAHLTGEGRDRFSMFTANLILVWKGLARASQSGAYVDGYLCDVNSTIFAFLGRVIPGVVKLASPGNIVQHSPICSK